jgi:phosphate-selective porin OprO/OprP
MNFNKKLAVAVSGAVLLMAGQVAMADSTSDIVDALVGKGVLTEEEGKLITKGHESKTKVTPVIKEKDGSFTIEDAKGHNSIGLTGRMHLDYRASSLDSQDLGPSARGDDRDTASMADQFELRRARIGIKGKIAKDFKYEVVGNLPGTATVDVAYLDFAKFDAFQIRAGKFKQPFGLEELISSNNMTMMERSYLDQTVPGKKIGVQVMGAPSKGLTYALSTFQNNDVERNLHGDGYASGAGRFTLNFAELMDDKTSVMHLGLAGLSSTYTVQPTTTSQTSGSADGSSSAGRASINAFRSAGRGLANIFRGQIGGGACTTAVYSCPLEFGAKVVQEAAGLEGIFARGPFKVMGEYSRGQYKAEHNSGTNVSYDTDTFYAEAGYFITGEKYADSYKNGVFGGFKPMNNFDLDKGQLGAIELAFRFEGFRVEDTNLGASGLGSRLQGTLDGSGTANGTKSKADTYTAGIRWILNPNVVFKANYAYTNLGRDYAPLDVSHMTSAGAIASSSATPANVSSEQLFMTRFQYMF